MNASYHDEDDDDDDDGSSLWNACVWRHSNELEELLAATPCSSSQTHLLACLIYGAIFSMLGTLFYKRSMVVAAGYLIGSEVFLATIPAVIGKLTMRFHLQELGIRWIGFFLPFDSEQEYIQLYGPQWPTWANLLVLIGTGCATLIIGGLVIVNRQYITSDET